jgi:hypothetical protein
LEDLWIDKILIELQLETLTHEMAQNPITQFAITRLIPTPLTIVAYRVMIIKHDALRR